MSKIYERIQGEIEAKICPEHHRRPTINIVNDNVMMICCCTPFESACYTKIIEILSGEAIRNKQEVSEHV